MRVKNTVMGPVCVNTGYRGRPLVVEQIEVLQEEMSYVAIRFDGVLV